MHIQTLIVLLAIGLSISYAFWRIIQALGKTGQDPCAGCQGCPLREEMRKKNRKRGQKTRYTGKNQPKNLEIN